MTSPALDFRVLGPLEVSRAGTVLALARGKERSLLALLVLNRNEVVPVDRILEELWHGSPPRTAQTALHGYVGKLRKLLGSDRLVTRGSGYLLRVDGGEVDADRFEQLLRDGRSTEALALWRGQALFDVQDYPFAHAEIGRLEELRTIALERSLEAMIDEGRAAEAVSQLECLVREQPFRERLRALLMLALYRTGRQADALAAYREMRSAFAEELGIEPSSEVRRLEQRILAQDPALSPRATAPAAITAPPAQEERKVVTVVHCGLVGSPGEMDPERFRSILERFVDGCTEVIERHGGTVAAISGEAVVGVFGLPRAREDDAVRALRAAAELGQARIGVATGEALVGGRLSVPTGDAVNAAARLQEGSAPSVVVLDAATLSRCRDTVSVEPVSADAYRLLSPPSAAEPFARRLDVPLVGREHEVGELHDVFQRTVERRAPYLLTVLGAPGLGKTRLALEFCAEVAGRARVLTGRCVPYGVAHGPLQEIAAGLADEPEAAALTEGQPAQQDLIRAFRRVVRSLAAAAPLVLVVEDAHWADEGFLDLLEHVLDFDADLPLMVLCLARPEFADQHAAWLGRRQNARSLRLAALSPLEARAHVDHLGQSASDELRARVVAVAEGNPLFAEQLLSHALERGGTVETPATLEALLAARVDGLEPSERALLGAAAVVGEEFSLSEVRELLPGESPGLAALVRRDLVRPAGPGSFQFSHALIRDAAYAGLLKRTRAGLHERFADALEERAPEQDVLVGYHLEAAHRALAEAGGDDAHAAELARRAAEALGRAGWSAQYRSDFASAEGLVTRALALLESEDPQRPELLILYARSVAGPRRHLEGIESFREAAVLARRLGNRGIERLAELYLHQQLLATEAATPVAEVKRLEAEARAAAKSFEEAEEDRMACAAWLVVHSATYLRGDYRGGLDALDRAIAHGRRSGTIEVRMVSRPLLLHIYGPTPSSEGLVLAEQLLDDDPGLAATADGFAYGGVLHAMRGDFDRGREWVLRSHELWREAGSDAVGWFGEQGMVEILAGNWQRAESALTKQCEILDGPGLETVFATYAAALAQAQLELGRDDEADRWARAAGERGAKFDVPVQAVWRAVRACVLARRGEHKAAAQLAREAVALSLETDDLWCRGDVHLRVSEVHELAGRAGEAIAAAKVAVETYEAKEQLSGVERARNALSRLAPSRA